VTSVTQADLERGDVSQFRSDSARDARPRACPRGSSMCITNSIGTTTGTAGRAGYRQSALFCDIDDTADTITPRGRYFRNQSETLRQSNRGSDPEGHCGRQPCRALR
jgi:hypothetical protein